VHAHRRPARAAVLSGTSQRRLLITALVLTGLSLRTAVTSVGAALDELQDGLHTSSTVAGVITTLPVVCFAGLGALTPRLSRAAGPHRLLTGALVLSTVGLATRPVANTAVVFVLISVVALAGSAVSNVLLPSLVKEHFPDRIGAMTALYTTALAVGTTAAAGLTVPIGSAGDGWRTGLGAWAVLSALAVLPWLPTLRAERTGSDVDEPAVHVSMRALLRSRTAWGLTTFFGVQSMQAYIAFGWFARFLAAHGVTHSTAGAMVAALTAVGIPVSLFAPRVGPGRQRAVIFAFCACNAGSYIGLVFAPAAGGWVWMVLAGVGTGMFPISLVLIGQRSRTPATTAALSAFVQAIGYIVAGAGPILFGAFYGATGSWGLSLAVLFVSLAATVATAWPSTADRYVDDELGSPSAKLSA
jgi:CP family cyanate transporter-like MFS transporter